MLSLFAMTSCRTVQPLVSIMSGLALQTSRCSTIRVWPSLAAMCRAVCPFSPLVASISHALWNDRMKCLNLLFEAQGG